MCWSGQPQAQHALATRQVKRYASSYFTVRVQYTGQKVVNRTKRNRSKVKSNPICCFTVSVMSSVVPRAMSREGAHTVHLDQLTRRGIEPRASRIHPFEGRPEMVDMVRLPSKCTRRTQLVLRHSPANWRQATPAASQAEAGYNPRDVALAATNRTTPHKRANPSSARHGQSSTSRDVLDETGMASGFVRTKLTNIAILYVNRSTSFARSSRWTRGGTRSGPEVSHFRSTSGPALVRSTTGPLRSTSVSPPVT